MPAIPAATSWRVCGRGRWPFRAHSLLCSSMHGGGGGSPFCQRRSTQWTLGPAGGRPGAAHLLLLRAPCAGLPLSPCPVCPATRVWFGSGFGPVPACTFHQGREPAVVAEKVCCWAVADSDGPFRGPCGGGLHGWMNVCMDKDGWMYGWMDVASHDLVCFQFGSVWAQCGVGPLFSLLSGGP